MMDKFNPAQHLIQLKGKDYLEVKWRLVWLRTEHPDAIIDTDLNTVGESYAIFKATISIPGGGSATGWGSEEASDFGDFLEKAETKAIGRALGALGFGTQFTDEHEFVDRKGQRVVNSPVERRPRPAAPAPATSALDAAFSAKAPPSDLLTAMREAPDLATLTRLAKEVPKQLSPDETEQLRIAYTTRGTELAGLAGAKP